MNVDFSLPARLFNLDVGPIVSLRLPFYFKDRPPKVLGRARYGVIYSGILITNPEVHRYWALVID